MVDNVEDIHTDEAREARRLLTAAFETVPADPATAGDGCCVRSAAGTRAAAEPAPSCRRARQRRRPGQLPRCCCQ